MFVVTDEGVDDRENEDLYACYYSEHERRDKFRRFNARSPKFGGEDGPLKARLWVLKLERLFKFLDCSDEENVSFATIMLENDAIDWAIWLEKNVAPPITWKDFKKEFLERYHPSWMQKENFTMLCKLVQGDKTVVEYDKEFDRLFHLAGECIQNDAMKSSMFFNGLRSEFKLKIDSMQYADIRDVAIKLERDFV
ncbi:uncharacterized protein LOC111008300 [Momordica charantia]|uniref:Uncharacterized protein LOC111008300 n=1 Tax=Momordica charantia TaxID=3673 RepID=A0A6J1C434_MOMCH|nr:uncharacterized protein LOC111008300 [Momordica charantia]